MAYSTQVPTSVARLNYQRYISNWILRLVLWAGDLMDRLWKETSGRNHSALQVLLFQYPLLCELLSELRSFLGRIEIVCTQELWRLGVAFGPSVELSPAGVLVECSQTRNRIHDSRKLRQQYPWASATDLLLFLNGFEAAETTPLRNAYNEIEFADLPSPILNLTVSQSPKLSSSLPQPSQASHAMSDESDRSCNARSVAPERPLG